MTARITITALITTSFLTLGCHSGEPAHEQTASATVGCVTLPESGLTWELKTDDGGIHDKDHTYRWGGNGAEQQGKIFFDDWNNLVNATNTEKLCGFDDWRVPTIDELKTLVTNTSGQPVFDGAVFPFTLTQPYWSASAYAHYPEHAQTVDFSTGTSHYYQGFRGNHLPLRLVRGQQGNIQ